VAGARVAVIGSGPAGLAAAFRLHQAGCRVRLFEREDRVGGRTRTERRDGFVINQGATIFSTGYHSMLGIIADAGLGHEVVPVSAGLGFVRAPDDVFEFDTDHLVRGALRFPLSTRARLVATKLGYDVVRCRTRMRYEDLELAADLDVESAEDYGCRRLNDELLREVVRPAAYGLVAAPAREVSAVDLMFALNRFAGIGTRWLALRDGSASYCARLAELVDVQLSARVDEVEEIGDEVAVSYTGPVGAVTERFAGCVLALPAPITAAIHPALTASRREFLLAAPYAAMTVVNLALRRPPPGIDSAFYAHPETEEIFTSVFEHNKLDTLVPAGKGLVSLYPNDEMSREMMTLPDSDVIDRVVKAAESVLPPMRGDIEFALVRHWEHGAFHGRVGHYRDLARFRATPDKRIQLAGDYFAPTSMNTASTSGERAAAALRAVLG
jgi:oxygen-dependent protoporphyrinogen oxidase